ncbi:MAG: sigma-54-dependent Fis family transcriptional regulator [Deltaproteobacteria bacterium]|nr:sigma-54-dependent Fis family transcriptional regulator [Deltaproteobacteria bacterium]
METILIVDDEKNYPPILSAVLKEEGFETFTANSGPEALQILENSDVDLVLTDMKMPVMDGIELLEKVKMKDPKLPIIMMTAYGTVEKAVEAMQKGAYNYILKPFDNERLVIYVNKALEMYRMVKENRELRSAMESRFGFGNIIGKSKEMQEVFKTIRQVAPTTATVILDESELFGHEKGSFTGAMAMKKGRFELADGGTLFLDEIGDLSQNLQVKLLRILQEKVFERVGGVKSISVDIRIITATNKRLKEEIQAGRFREDLFYRLNVLSIVLPPLRERIEDIHVLIDHFIKKYRDERRSDIPIVDVDPEVERLFYDYRWPGNVRELENVIERAIILCPGEIITVSDLPKDFKDNVYDTHHLDGIPVNAKLHETLNKIEKKMIERALQLTNNVQSNAAELLGIGRSGFNKKIRKHSIQVTSQ